MSIRPIDMSGSVTRLADMQKVNSPDSARPEVLNHHFATQLDKETRQMEQQVQTTEKSDQQTQVEEDGHGGAWQGGQSRRQKRNAEKQADKPPEDKRKSGLLGDEERNIFDIRV